MRAWVSFTVPLVPPSVNHYKQPGARGGYYVTAEALAFKDAVAIFARDYRGHLSGERHGVQLRIFMAAKQRGDVDNFAKVALDALIAAGVLGNDDSVCDLRLSKSRDSGNPRTEFLVWDTEERPELNSAWMRTEQLISWAENELAEDEALERRAR